MNIIAEIVVAEVLLFGSLWIGLRAVPRLIGVIKGFKYQKEDMGIYRAAQLNMKQFIALYNADPENWGWYHLYSQYYLPRYRSSNKIDTCIIFPSILDFIKFNVFKQLQDKKANKEQSITIAVELTRDIQSSVQAKREQQEKEALRTLERLSRGVIKHDQQLASHG